MTKTINMNPVAPFDFILDREDFFIYNDCGQACLNMGGYRLPDGVSGNTMEYIAKIFLLIRGEFGDDFSISDFSISDFSFDCESEGFYMYGEEDKLLAFAESFKKWAWDNDKNFNKLLTASKLARSVFYDMAVESSTIYADSDKEKAKEFFNSTLGL